MNRKKQITIAGVGVALIAAWWLATSPPDYIEIAPPYTQLLPEGPPEVRDATPPPARQAGGLLARRR